MLNQELAIMSGAVEAMVVDISDLPELGITFIQGRKALGIDVVKNQVHLEDATRLDYDALLLATGSRHRSVLLLVKPVPLFMVKSRMCCAKDTWWPSARKNYLGKYRHGER